MLLLWYIYFIILILLYSEKYWTFEKEKKNILKRFRAILFARLDKFQATQKFN